MLFFKQWPVSYNTPYEKIGDEVRSLADEVPFDIPDSWEWVRLGNISSYAETKQKVNATSADPSIWGLDLEDIEKGGRLLEYKTVGERKAVGDKTVFTNGICTPEIVPFRVYGGIDPSYIVNYLKSPYLIRTRYSSLLCPQYLKYFMESPLYWQQLKSGTTATAQPNCNGQTLAKMLLPLPPANEQLRIVDNLARTFAIIERM